MTISELIPPTMAVHERERLREALVRRTQLAIAEVDRALAHTDEPRYGVCKGCRRVLPIATLTRSPVETHCSVCIPLERSNWL